MWSVLALCVVLCETRAPSKTNGLPKSAKKQQSRAKQTRFTKGRKVNLVLNQNLADLVNPTNGSKSYWLGTCEADFHQWLNRFPGPPLGPTGRLMRLRVVQPPIHSSTAHVLE